MPPSSVEVDEWIFTLRVPTNAATASVDGDGDVVEIRQPQRKPPSKDRIDLQTAAAATAAGGSTTIHTSLSAHDLDDSLNERVSLLNDDEITQSASTRTGNDDNDRTQRLPHRQATGTEAEAGAGWTLQSPHWSLRTISDTLLTITYCHAWQAIPEYTAQNLCGKSAEPTSLSRACCLQTPCSALTAPEVEYIQETFTTADIARIETTTKTGAGACSCAGSDGTDTQPLQVNVPGLGMCRAIRIYLRPLTLSRSPIPTELDEAWERHVQRMHKPKQARKTTNETDLSYSDYIGPVITFCVPMDATDPPLLWKVWLPAIHDYPIAVQTITVLDGKLNLSPPPQPQPQQRADTYTKPPTHIYINGYQSWSFSGSIPKGTSQPGSALPNAFSRAFNLGASPPPAPSTIFTTSDERGNANTIASEPEPFHPCYQSDFFTCITSDGRSGRAPLFSSERRFPYQQLDETGGPALVLGWLSQAEQFGLVMTDQHLCRYQMHCSVDGQILLASASGVDNGQTRAISTDWAFAQLVHPHSYDEEPMADFLHSVATASEARPLLNGSLLTGWCSWYVFYEKINAKLLRDNFTKLTEMRVRVPTNVSVVDDGYMTAWGDWDSLKDDAFPDGLLAISEDISSHGMRPGLWLAPFAADKHSDVARNHPDWIICNDGGVAANSSHCGKFFYGLDATNPAVRAHVHEAIQRATQKWKFNVLKIDFLYAACLEGNGRYDLSVSRAQAMHMALETIRAAAGPDVFLIGCGCPIASGIGYVDAMRISADTGPTWYPALPLPWWDNGTLPALRSMVRNSMARAPMGHRWWHNDPDCLMLGNHTSLTDDEVASAASVVAMTCGMLLLSDDLPKVSTARVSIVSKIFPLTGVTAAVLDLHCSTNDGLPSLMRLWCTDKYNLYDSFREDMEDRGTFDHNAKATFLARKASFNPTAETPLVPSERMRSCIHMTKGLGTWTVVSISNWTDLSAVVRIPPMAMRPPPTTGWESNGGDEDANDTFLGGDNVGDGKSASLHGYHVFAFWSSKYSWIAHHKEDENDDPDHTVCKKLRQHETELFHIKKVTPDMPQYIGSDLHFSCGFEVTVFRAQSNSVTIFLNTNYRRDGFIFVFVPRVNVDNVVQATVGGVRALWNVTGTTPTLASSSENASPRIVGRIIRVAVIVYSDGRPRDGQVNIEF